MLLLAVKTVNSDWFVCRFFNVPHIIRNKCCETALTLYRPYPISCRIAYRKIEGRICMRPANNSFSKLFELITAM